ncbi:hypothetical protein COJ86_01500 [Bacillus cereus]|nr:hypothetical protein COJ86_01500 [Bacillus cereus]
MDATCVLESIIDFKAEAARSESLFSMGWSHMLVHEIMSTIFQIYRRFFHYIDDSTQNIDLPKNHDNISASLPYFYQYITIPFMLKYR